MTIPSPSTSAADSKPTVIASAAFTEGMVHSTIFARAVKRAFDIIVASIGLILFSPVLLLSSLAIVLDCRGPIIIRSVRHGYGNETFRIFTFRCSVHKKIASDIQPARRGAHVTGVGRILQSSGLDGFPQLINVLRGDMSIVGPRPYITLPGAPFEDQIARIEDQIARISQRRGIKPGLTGWAQVHGNRDDSNSFRVIRRRIEYDLYYVENWSLLLDMKIVLMTLCSRKAYLLRE